MTSQPSFRSGRSRSGPTRERLAGCFVFAWPLLYLGIYLIPLPGIGRQSGNDFRILYYEYKAYLLDVLVNQGRIPLWSPSEAAGFPFYSNPFAQALYPLNLPLALYRAAAGGYSMHDHQIFTVLGISILALGLFRWLRATRTPILPCLVATLALATCMKTTELLRLPNAIHTAAWIPWILLGMTRAAESRTRLRGCVIVACSSVMLLTGGYLYYAYYLQFLLVPYFALLQAGSTRRALLGSEADAFPGTLKFGSSLAVAFGAAVGVCTPYLWKVAQLLGQTAARGGDDFAFATRSPWDLVNVAGSLVFPPGASAEGWYYFGILNLLVLLLYVVGVWGPQRDASSQRRLVLWIGAWFAMVSAISLEGESPLFRALWHGWPGFSSLRVWPRINILLVPALALLLARAYAAMFARVGETGEAKRPLVALAGIYAIVLAVQSGFLATGYRSHQWPRYFAAQLERVPAIGEWWYLAIGLASCVLLATWIAASQKRRLQPLGVVPILLLLTVVDVGPMGILQWSRPKSEQDLVREPLDVIERMPSAFVLPRINAYGTIRSEPPHSVGAVEAWYYTRYLGFLESQGVGHADLWKPESWRREPGVAQLLGMEDGRRLYFVGSLEHDSVESFLEDARSADDGLSGLEVLRYDGDELVARIEPKRSGHLAWIDNWDPNWRAEIDGRPLTIETLWGTFKAVPVDPGPQTIRFVYDPL